MRLVFRTLIDVIPLDATLVKGSHGRPGLPGNDGPLILTRQKSLLRASSIDSVAVYGVILEHLGAGHAR
jgi:hypothetical protein